MASLPTQRARGKFPSNAGVHLEIDPGGSKMSILEKEGGQSPVCMCISTCTLGGSGGMLPQEIFDY